MTKPAKQQEQAKVLPFRVIAFRIPAADFEKIEHQLAVASFHINADWQLDWEDRLEAGRAIADALCALREIKKKADFRI